VALIFYYGLALSVVLSRPQLPVNEPALVEPLPGGRSTPNPGLP
jgi:hypothetical protein